MIPELPVRRVARRGAPRLRRLASSYSSTRTNRKTVVELVAVCIVDLILIVALFHPGIVRSIFTSMQMTIPVLTATSGGGA